MGFHPERDHLAQGNSLVFASDRAVEIGGALAGGALVAAIGDGAFYVDALTFALSAVLLARIVLSEHARPVTWERVSSDARSGLEFLRRSRVLWSNTLFSLAAQFANIEDPAARRHALRTLAFAVLFAGMLYFAPAWPVYRRLFPAWFAAPPLATGVLLWQGGASAATAGYALCLVSLLVSPVVYPWYLIWVLAFVPLLHRHVAWTGLAWSATAAVSYLLWHAPQWQLSRTAMLAEYAPVYLAAAWEVTRWRCCAATAPPAQTGQSASRCN